MPFGSSKPATHLCTLVSVVGLLPIRSTVVAASVANRSIVPLVSGSLTRPIPLSSRPSRRPMNASPKWRTPTMATADPIHDYLAGIGRRGGLVRSRKKTEAAIANGRKGGRPRSGEGPRCRLCFNQPACKAGGNLCRNGHSAFVPSHMSRAKPASLKQSRIGRCQPNASGVRPSKRKK